MLRVAIGNGLQLHNAKVELTNLVPSSDRVFVAVLYTSEEDKSMRYTDEGAIDELCKWSVDLGMLPSFQMHAQMNHPKGFYTEFELGLELDSAEVRGVLLHGGEEVSRVVFDFFQ